MRKIYLFLIASVILSGCLKHEYPNQNDYEQRLIRDNVVTVFGAEFSEDQDWCTTANGEVLVKNIPSGTKKVQLIAKIMEGDGETSMKVLNEYDINGETNMTIYYDAPKDVMGLFVSFITSSDFKIMVVENGVAEYANKAMTRSSASNYALPTETPKIALNPIESYAMQRKWIDEEYLYTMYYYKSMQANDYSDEYRDILRSVIFSYFKNGRSYDNLPLVKRSGFYNENAYPITTGDEPIIVSPVYKCDKAKQYGNEVWNSELYYYYFKESDLEGKDPIDYISHLQKISQESPLPLGVG